MQVARAKVQEAKPVFCRCGTCQCAVAAFGNQQEGDSCRILFFLAVAGASAWILFGREFFENLKAGLNAPQEGMEKK